MIFDRLGVIAAFFGLPSTAGADVAARWQKAFARDDELACDLIRQSGLLDLQPVQMTDGYPEPVTLDPLRLAYEAGRRDLALTLLAQGGITITELNKLMEANEP